MRSETLRIIEVSHALLLLLFTLCSASVFNVMPLKSEIASYMKEASQLHCDCFELLGSPEASPAGWSTKRAGAPQPLNHTEDRCAEVSREWLSTQPPSGSGNTAGDGDRKDSKTSAAERCYLQSKSRFTILPFLVALLGGGVFSLEAFEAFPML